MTERRETSVFFYVLISSRLDPWQIGGDSRRWTEKESFSGSYPSPHKKDSSIALQHNFKQFHVDRIDSISFAFFDSFRAPKTASKAEEENEEKHFFACQIYGFL